jgi:hypothetical protein
MFRAVEKLGLKKKAPPTLTKEGKEGKEGKRDERKEDERKKKTKEVEKVTKTPSPLQSPTSNSPNTPSPSPSPSSTPSSPSFVGNSPFFVGCGVCLEPILESTPTARAFPCDHVFCERCVRMWMHNIGPEGDLRCMECNIPVNFIFDKEDSQPYVPPGIGEVKVQPVVLEEDYLPYRIVQEVDLSSPGEGHLFGGAHSASVSVERSMAEVDAEGGLVFIPQVIGKGMFESLYKEVKPLLMTPAVVRGTREAFASRGDDLEECPLLEEIIRLGVTKTLGLKEVKSPEWWKEVLCQTGIFVNYYKDGSRYAPLHQDSYSGLTSIISIGGSRDFQWAKKSSKKIIGERRVRDGDLAIFTKSWNANHKHTIPKCDSQSPRISIVIFFDT